MKKFCLVVALLAAGSIALAAESHHHPEDTPNKLALDHGKKWATDAPLRQAMATLRAALADKRHGIDKGTLGKDEYAALGAGIERQIEAIVSQCKLDPKADAMLHVIIGELAAAADVLQGKSAGKPAMAAHHAVNALNGYGKYFDHPGWQALR